MFFVVSKLFWLVAQPISLCVLLVLLGGVLIALRRTRLGLASGAVGLLVLVLSAYTSLGSVMIAPLENRYRAPEALPQSVSAIVVLGGSTYGRISAARGSTELNEAGERLVEAVRLARAYPEASVILSGGSGLLVPDGEPEAETAGRLLQELGIAPERLVLESQSRNTQENAELTRALIGPDGTTILVTSAFHMPRSVALFEKAGLPVVPWPSDYRSTGTEGFGIDLANPVLNLTTTGVAMREWIGLVVYALTGRIDGVFPGPERTR